MHPLFLQVPPPATSPAEQAVKLDALELILKASGPVFVVVWLLLFAAAAVWIIAVLKLLQLRRWRRAERRFETDAATVRTAAEFFEVGRLHTDAPGGRVAVELEKHSADPQALTATAKRAVVAEQQQISSMMSLLATVGSASPFIGLFGTVWGIMDAFLRIGLKKSASLPVVAPAIGEALIATAIGLFAAIPAVIAYNAIAKRQDDLLTGLEAAADGWVALIGVEPNTALPPLNPPPRAARPRARDARSATPGPVALTPSAPRASDPPPYPGGS